MAAAAVLSSPGSGRYLAAARGVEAGAVLACADRPYSSSPARRMCGGCLAPAAGRCRCRRCGSLFCGAGCRRRHRDEPHGQALCTARRACAVLPDPPSPADSGPFVLLTSAAARLWRESTAAVKAAAGPVSSRWRGKARARRRLLRAVDGGTPVLLPPRRRRRNPRTAALGSLCVTAPESAEYLSQCRRLLLAYHAAQRRLGERCLPSLRRPLLGMLLVRLATALRSNAFAADGCLLLYPGRPSYFNHSCAPTAVRVHCGLLGVRFVATEAAELHQPLTISYLGKEGEEMPTATRQQILRVKYGFECRCRRCVEP
eukprot:TRINITY_DN2333_c0_g1_i2.p1 TRINITY_DN2333_c0_g1~~TRINITY_DN2333_c0_g1_i2.p1  ORF type:complete len:332 (+),score=70.19 TRINITY_DN2333_c0_g1_i2:52-996(+)